MEIEVGEYVRTDIGLITKADVCWFIDFLIKGKSTFGKAVKHSKDIIDLIECGDILFFADGSICRIQNIVDGYYLLKDLGGEQYYQKIEIITMDIKSIVTKEQFEKIEYKVKE